MASSTLVGMVHILFLCTYVSATGFTTDLIHRDSPLSPFYNPSSTHHDRIQRAIQRSFNRISHFNNKLHAPLTPGQGEYLMKVSLGTPPAELLAIADTGSDLTWTQCFPCTHCFKQTLPLFDPRHSSSYKTISCDSDSCNALPIQTCGQKNACGYTYSYGDGSQTQGDLSSETFTIGSSNNSSIPKILFGCGHSSGGTFEPATNGLVGLGAGKLSLVSQLGANGKKFSYCLSSEANSTSRISFGSDAAVSGSGVVTTPIVRKSGQETFYYLTLESLSVGSKRIALAHRNDGTRNDDADEGNIIIDSGTTLTYLPSHVVDGLVSAVEKAIGGGLPKVDDPSGTFQLCYRDDGTNKDGGLGLPSVTAHFKGADVVLQANNMFVEADDHTLCLAVVPADDISILGNTAQMNFLVGYDLDAHVVSFKPTDCTKQQ